jgi:DNA-binding beta-propeller fold protein YncE
MRTPPLASPFACPLLSCLLLPCMLLALPLHAAERAAPQNDALRNFGSATAGATGAPEMWANDAPRQATGLPFAFRIENAAGTSAAFPVVAFAAAHTTIAGLEVNLPPNGAFVLPLVVTDPHGAATVPMTIPSAPPLLGLDLFAQVIVVDATSLSPLQLTSSRGLQLSIAGAPQLFVAEVAGSLQEAIDLTTGTTSVVGASASNIAAYSRDGRRLFLQGTTSLPGGRSQGLVRFFDTTLAAPVPLGSPPTFATAGVSVNRLVLTPDGHRLYVVEGNQPSFGFVEVLDADAASPGFGTPVVPPVPMPFAVPIDLAFAPDGLRAYVTTLGLNVPVSIAVLDTDPASATYHQVVGGVPVPGGPICTAIEMDPAGRYLYIALNSGGSEDIAVLDVTTLTLVDFDPSTPGVQHLGWLYGLGAYINDMVVLPRGGQLLCGERGGVRLIDVLPTSPTLGNSVFVPLGTSTLANVFAIAVSPAGDRLYAAEYTSHQVTEFDSTLSTVLRLWPTVNAPEGLGIR